eukprot:scaffold297032_cov22-Tisochrysis_lutea.AAC.1
MTATKTYAQEHLVVFSEALVKVPSPKRLIQQAGSLMREAVRSACPSLTLTHVFVLSPFQQEHALYPHAVSALVDGRISWREDGIPILWSDS